MGLFKVGVPKKEKREFQDFCGVPFCKQHLLETKLSEKN
jgi:hypothetical protein